MKKILTVSLFAMMAVSAANADIASTNYVDNAKTSAISTAASDATSKANAAKEAAISAAATDATSKANAAKEAAISAAATDATSKANAAKEAAIAAIPAVDSEFSATSDNAATSKAIATYFTSIKNELSNGNTQVVEDFKSQIKDMDDAKADKANTLAGYGITDAMTATEITSAISTAKSEAIAASDTKGAAAQALADAKTYADAEDKKIEDTIGTVTQGKTVVEMISDVGTAASTNLTNTLKNYSTTEQMNIAITNNAVNTVLSGSDDGTIAVDGKDVAVKGLGTAAYTASSAYDASGSAAAAQTAAVAAAKTETTTQVNALKNGAVKTNTDNITTITTNLGGLKGVVIPAACQTGRCALVMEDGKAKWETING